MFKAVGQAVGQKKSIRGMCPGVLWSPAKSGDSTTSYRPKGYQIDALLYMGYHNKKRTCRRILFTMRWTIRFIVEYLNISSVSLENRHIRLFILLMVRLIEQIVDINIGGWWNPFSLTQYSKMVGRNNCTAEKVTIVCEHTTIRGFRTNYSYLVVTNYVKTMFI